MSERSTGLRNIPLIQLRAFSALADRGSYTQVASELSYTEPAIHMQIRNLERTAGVPLVQRQGNRIILTEYGMRILPLVREVIERAEALEFALGHLQGGEQIVVGAGRVTGVTELMPLLSSYRALTAEQVELHLLPPKELAAGLVSGTLDVVLAGDTDPFLSLADRNRLQLSRSTWGVRSARWALICPPEFRMKLRRRTRTLAPTTIFVPPWSRPYLEELRLRCQALIPESELSILETLEAVRGAVAAGLGAGLVSLRSLQPGELENLTELVAMVDGPRVRIHLIHKHPRLLNDSSRTFVDFLCRRRKLSRPKAARVASAPVRA